jgi:hypothetical protein
MNPDRYVLHAGTTGRALVVAQNLMCADGVVPVVIGGTVHDVGVLLFTRGPERWRAEDRAREWWLQRQSPGAVIAGSPSEMKLLAWNDNCVSLDPSDVASLKVLGRIRPQRDGSWHLFATASDELPMSRYEAEELGIIGPESLLAARAPTKMAAAHCM